MSHSDFVKCLGNSLYALSKIDLNMNTTINALPFTILRKPAEILYIDLVLKEGTRNHQLFNSHTLCSAYWLLHFSVLPVVTKASCHKLQTM